MFMYNVVLFICKFRGSILDLYLKDSAAQILVSDTSNC